jgi:hypothetical protein
MSRRDQEDAARITLIDHFAAQMSLPLTAEQVADWVEALADLPLGWLAVGVKRTFALFDRDRRPRPADIRRHARQVAGAVLVQDDEREYWTDKAWPDEVRALRLLREGAAITPFRPLPTIVGLPELPQQAGDRTNEPERVGDVIRALLEEPEIHQVKS